MAKHTPGPWSLETVPTSVGSCHRIGCFPGTDLHPIGYACVYADRIRIDLDDSNPRAVELLANARLIAAAPELLEALIWMVENDETNEGDEPVDELGGASWNEFNAYWIDGLKKAKAAIAKATGEQP